MICPFCKDNVTEFDSPEQVHIIGSKSLSQNHIHIHGDIAKKEIVKEIYDVMGDELGVAKAYGSLDLKEVVFHNRQRIGDMLMFTCAVRDFKAAFPHIKVNVVSIAQHIWDFNPHVDRSVVPTKENTVMIGPGKLTNASNRLDWHFANAYRVSMEDALKVHIPQGESRPDIWFSHDEYNAPRITEKPYWIICITGEKGWGCKMYPVEKWQKFIDQNPDTLFYQIGAKEDNPPRLKGDNVIDFVGQTQSKLTGIRDLFKLFLNAEGSIGLVSFHMHLSGALYKPCIVVAGAREPVSFTRYPGHRYLSTDGCLPCSSRGACWHCDISTCSDLVVKGEERIPRCVDMIEPEDLTKALNDYYLGGRLKKGVASVKPKIKNLVKADPVIIQEEVKLPDVNTYGMSFGGGSLTDRDWEFIRGVLNEHKVKTVLEFGAGLSTLLLNDNKDIHVITLETNQRWIDKIKAINPKCDIRLWDGKEVVLSPEHPENKYNFDLVFVDGPAGDKAREESTRIGASLGKIVIVHDAGREWARKYQDQYLLPGFDGPIKGGHRSHLWIKKGVLNETKKEMPKESCKKVETCGGSQDKALGKKFVKIVSTARGWGGCARSVTTIMRLLIQQGHKVEFIPFRNSVGSREFKEILSKDLHSVKVSLDYTSLRESCDVLLVYADDYVWEFERQELADIFSDIGADKKIMMLNYRRGKVGTIPWTKGWDKYMSLNSIQEKELLKILPGVKTKVLPPCTDLTEFFKVTPDYNHNLRIVRHSSQGDTKFYPDYAKDVDEVVRVVENVELAFLPGPSFINPAPRIRKVGRVANPAEIADFLKSGNLFWYSLPPGYMDMGPRVILEAMAAGLPVVADNWGGAVDRVTPETGWLCDDKSQHVEIFKHVTAEELKRKGEAARERAKQEFVPEAWIRELFQ